MGQISVETLASPGSVLSGNQQSGPNGSYVLSEEVADWCWDNIGPYRLFSEWGPNTPNSWGPLSVKIEFKSSNDLLIFTLRWG